MTLVLYMYNGPFFWVCSDFWAGCTPELGIGRRRWGGSPVFPSYQRVVTRPRCPLPFFCACAYVCETVQACEAWNYKCGAAVDLLRKLNYHWKVKPRDGKNKDGEREQDKEEVRVPEGTACSLVKFGLKNLNWRQCVLSFSSHCRQTIDIFMNLQIIKFKRTEEKHYPSGVVELKENSGLQ